MDQQKRRAGGSKKMLKPYCPKCTCFKCKFLNENGKCAREGKSLDHPYNSCEVMDEIMKFCPLTGTCKYFKPKEDKSNG
jgi:hypothetical protein